MPCQESMLRKFWMLTYSSRLPLLFLTHSKVLVACIYHILIDLVADTQHIMFLTQIRYHLQFTPTEYLGREDETSITTYPNPLVRPLLDDEGHALRACFSMQACCFVG